MIIFGAGMAGLLAGNMLRRHSPIIFEQQASLPNNHAALLRFRTDAIAKLTGIPFRKVRVEKAIYDNGRLHTESSIRLNNTYSQKVLGRIIPRSIGNLEPGDRYIAPPDFISQMARSCKIEYNSSMEQVLHRLKDSKIISTIPMPALIKSMPMLLSNTSLTFDNLPITTIRFDIPNCDVYQTIYFPGHEFAFYRASITGNHMIIEFDAYGSDEKQALVNAHQQFTKSFKTIMSAFGIYLDDCPVASIKYQKYGKIIPLPTEVRQEVLRTITDQTGIYSLGRFATWRQVLLDDVVNDVMKIEGWMTSSNNAYQRALHYS